MFSYFFLCEFHTYLWYSDHVKTYPYSYPNRRLLILSFPLYFHFAICTSTYIHHPLGLVLTLVPHTSKRNNDMHVRKHWNAIETSKSQSAISSKTKKKKIRGQKKIQKKKETTNFHQYSSRSHQREKIPGQLEASFLIFLTLGSIKQSDTRVSEPEASIKPRVSERWSVPLRPNRSGCEKESGYSLPHWEAGKWQASSGFGPQSDLKINEIELNWTGEKTVRVKQLKLPRWPSLQPWVCPYVSLCSSYMRLPVVTGTLHRHRGPPERARAETGGTD